MESKALEVNLACTRVDVTVDDRFNVLLEVLGGQYGVRLGLQNFLKEICHPYRNWQHIVKEARSFALNYFHVLQTHPRGAEAAAVFCDIFFEALSDSRDAEVRGDSADHLLLFAQRMISEGEAVDAKWLPVLDRVFERIGGCPEESFFLFVRSYYQLSHLGRRYARGLPKGADCTPLNRLLERYLEVTYRYWLQEEDPVDWFGRVSGVAAGRESLANLLGGVSHPQLHTWLDDLESARRSLSADPPAYLNRLLSLPGYGQIVSTYEQIPERLATAGEDKRQGMEWQLLSLLTMMNLAGLSSIHEETLRRINRTFAEIIAHEPSTMVRQFLKKIFSALKGNIERYPTTGLNCVLNIGREVYRTDQIDLVDLFIDGVVSLGFQAPDIRGVGDDWQVRANAAHIQNIRTWLQLIEQRPKWSKKLLSSLIIHLSLGGVLIRDTDLFPRDITRFLNSDIGPVYHLVKQLGRLLPAFFTDIGAEGIIRDISTRIDEICRRRDPLSHFIRKQSHVESSNQIIPLMEAALTFWRTRKKAPLKDLLPAAIDAQIEATGVHVDGVHRVMTRLFDQGDLSTIHDLLYADMDRLKEEAGQVEGASDVDRERVSLMVTLYRLLYQKYRVSAAEIGAHLEGLRSSGLPDAGRLRAALAKEDNQGQIEALLDYLEALKQIILSPERYEPREDIYRKRHFAVDIPSMYGSYHELKFEALGLSFRLESLLNARLENRVAEMDVSLITKAAFYQIHETLGIFDRALRLDGISSLEMAQQLDLFATSLQMRGLSATQYLDIFRRFSQIVGNMVHDYFNNIHEENLLGILETLPASRLIPKYRTGAGGEDPDRMKYRVTEIFLRERIASSVGLQPLDAFVGHVLNTLHRQSHQLPKEALRVLFSYDPQKAVTPIHPVREGVSDAIHLGSKGHNLVKMTEMGLPVPPGFIVTTEVFRCREAIDRYPPAKRNLEEQVARGVGALETATGKSFGLPSHPLLLSVRSGSSISQPGMMNTFLDVGLNTDVVSGVVGRTGNPWFGWDTYRRFLQSYGMGFGLSRDAFDHVMQSFKEQIGVPYKRDFSGDQMRDVAMAYRSLIQEAGIVIMDDPLQQLLIAIEKVLDSWNGPKAQAFRKIMGISDDWGTAVTVQAMVFGNLSRESGAGVFFTHNPRWPGDMVLPWGDFTPGNQGEDVVSGLVMTHPISRKQAEIENRHPDSTLEALFPEIYRTLWNRANDLIYEQRWSPQEIEFTFEGPSARDLYFLQTRDMAIRERKRVDSLDPASQADVEFLGHGIGVSGGAMVGRAVFSIEEIKQWRQAEPNTSLIIVRSDTVPDDIKEIYEADGILTARGGSTSHAAIVAHRLDKTCVVGFPGLICMETERTCSFEGRHIGSGDWISMDGLDGSVYAGKMTIRRMDRG